MNRYRLFTVSFILLALLAAGLVPTLAQDDPGTLNIYSARHYGAMEAPFVKFQEDTGIEVRISAGNPRDLLSRLRADIERGNRSIADLLLSIDAGVLSLAATEGLLQPVQSDVLNANIAPEFRDPDAYWFGLSARTRTLIYNPANITEDEIASLTTYADLASETWAGRLCMRPASHIYTVSLFSSLVYHAGEGDVLPTLEGISNNVTRYINSDTRQIEAVAAGECDVAFVNTYYVARMAGGDEAQRETFERIRHVWMNQGDDSSGVFFNVNGAGVVKGAANYDNAVRFIEYMSQPENQCGDVDCFPGSNYEYPTNPAAELNPVLASFGEMTLDTDYALWDYGSYQEDTVILLEQAGFGFEEN
jgi:iron(III) transport system substrate-binding protein